MLEKTQYSDWFLTGPRAFVGQRNLRFVLVKKMMVVNIELGGVLGTLRATRAVCGLTLPTVP